MNRQSDRNPASYSLLARILTTCILAAWLIPLQAADKKQDGDDKEKKDASAQFESPVHLADEVHLTQGSASIGGKKTAYPEIR